MFRQVARTRGILQRLIFSVSTQVMGTKPNVSVIIICNLLKQSLGQREAPLLLFVVGLRSFRQAGPQTTDSSCLVRKEMPLLSDTSNYPSIYLRPLAGHRVLPTAYFSQLSQLSSSSFLSFLLTLFYISISISTPNLTISTEQPN